WAGPWRREPPGDCRRGLPRRVDAVIARSRLAGRGLVAEEIGSWHTEAIPYRNYTQQRDVQLHRRQVGHWSALGWGANQIPGVVTWNSRREHRYAASAVQTRLVTSTTVR